MEKAVCSEPTEATQDQLTLDVNGCQCNVLTVSEYYCAKTGMFTS